MCIEGAYTLSGLLAEVQNKNRIGEAFSVYDQLRRPRTQRLITTSREARQLYDLELEGESKDRIWANLENRMKWIWDHDIEAELEKGRKMLRFATSR
jgi:salicylate hydroxylase